MESLGTAHIDLDSLIQSARIIKILRGPDGTGAELSFLDNRVSVLCEGHIASSLDAEIQDQHLPGKLTAVSLRPAVRMDLIEANS